jgi:4-amino-4-deoxy-L-arabinose transferase-like glycosyltransferase
MTTAVRTWGPLAAILLLALSVRLAAAGWVERTIAEDPGRVCLIPGDADGYWELARKLLHGEDYALYDPPRFVLRMPGFPLLLAACRLDADSRWPARVVLSLVATATCALVYGLACELTNRRVALVAALATAVSPSLVVFSPLLLSESTFSAAITASVWSLARLTRPLPERSRGRDFAAALLAGGLIALATLIRPTWLPILAAAVVAVLRQHRGGPRGWRLAAGLTIGCTIVMSPWVIRNAVVTGQLVITTLWSGPSLYDGLRPGARGDSDMQFFEDDRLLDRMSEYEMNAEYRRRAWAFVAAQPLETLRLAVIKQARYWNVWPNAPQFDRPLTRLALLLATVPLYLGSLLGLWWSERNTRLVLCTAGPVLFFAALHLLFVGSLRYRLPAEPALWVLAAYGGVQLWQGWSPSSPVRS